MDGRDKMSRRPHPFLSGDKGPHNVTVPGTETATTSATYRHSCTSDAETHQQLVEEYRTRKNCVQQLQEQCKKLDTRAAVAYRPLEKIEHRPTCNAKGKEHVLEYYYYRERQEVSYAKLWHYIVSFGAGLRELGVPQRGLVTIYEETRWEWLVSIYGIWTHNMVATTVYSNLGEDALKYALYETNSAAIICNGRTVKTVISLLRAHGISSIIVYLDNLPVDLDTFGYRLVAWTEVMEKGVASNCAAEIPTDNDIEALIMYTSGTSGDPKGVLHTHGSIAAGVSALAERLSDLYPSSTGDETYCAFLPLAHILEFGIVNIFLQRGSLVGFSKTRTLTDEFAIPHGDFKEFSPKNHHWRATHL
ncbi:fatty acyl CoA syntetase 1 [Trypanosoma rangeli SC58]|uniref:Fatty acyl CoA syntetase 1 n=1 Tax=Trypanosoma rangeli SC58 TaxID=429131 RepID=A0A061JA09_TRYRA|nr:fatty acyl CoA syntetase 1 [Trypanosoma rangeli SC58]